MRNYRLSPTMLICLIGIFLLAACGSQSKDSESVSTSATSDDAFKQALQAQVSDMKDDNNRAAQQWKELEEKSKREAAEKQERLEQERLEKESAPYGYNVWGEPYASRDHKRLDKELDEFEKARQGFINATYSGNPLDLAFYHQRMKKKIDNCLGIARRIGDKDIIDLLEEYERMVDNIRY